MVFGLTVFIVVNFVPLHITSTDRSDPGLAFSHAHHVHDKDITASVRLAYCPHPRLIRTGIRQDSRCMAEEPFNFFLADPMFSAFRSEEHTSELQSLMRSSYAVFCLK